MPYIVWDLPEHFIIQGASEESSNSNIKLLFSVCVVSFQCSSVLISFPIQLLHQDSLMHCDVQDTNQMVRKLMLKLISTNTIPKFFAYDQLWMSKWLEKDVKAVSFQNST